MDLWVCSFFCCGVGYVCMLYNELYDVIKWLDVGDWIWVVFDLLQCCLYVVLVQELVLGFVFVLKDFVFEMFKVVEGEWFKYGEQSVRYLFVQGFDKGFLCCWQFEFL